MPDLITDESEDFESEDSDLDMDMTFNRKQIRTQASINSIRCHEREQIFDSGQSTLFDFLGKNTNICLNETNSHNTNYLGGYHSGGTIYTDSSSSEDFIDNYDVCTISNEAQDPLTCNNVKFKYQRIGIGKNYISGASCYPPQLRPDATVGAFDPASGQCTNCVFDGNVIGEHLNCDDNICFDVEQDRQGLGDMIGSTQVRTVSQDKNGRKHNLMAISPIEFTNKINIHHEVTKENTIIIPQTTDQWYITVPVAFPNGKVFRTKMFADCGANHACIKTSYAVKHFREFIVNNDRSTGLNTPGGLINPKFILWMTFPLLNGKVLKTRFCLVDKLPVDILADINMLRHFGYKFKDEIPPIFRHESEEDLDLQLRDMDDQFKLHLPLSQVHKEKQNQTEPKQSKKGKFKHHVGSTHWFKTITNRKLLNFRHIKFHESHLINKKHKRCVGSVLINGNSNLYDNIGPMDNQLYNHLAGTIKNDYLYIGDNLKRSINYIHDINQTGIPELANQEPQFLHIPPHPKGVVNETLAHLVHQGLYNPQFVDPKRLDPVRTIDMDAAISLVQKENKLPHNTLGFDKHQTLVIIPKQAFLASEEEIQEARKEFENKELVWNDIRYLKTYEKLYGPRFALLYERISELLQEYKDCFAKFTYDRRTMNVPPARLGIKPQFRNKIMYAPQYPINHIKRQFMIQYTEANEQNGFWSKITHSLHAVPYTMVPKKKHGIISRYRPAFDGRVVNQWCELQASNMPTLKDYADFHAIRGFTTVCDIKNCFDCIPLHPLDRKYAVAMTPLGLYQMDCLTYGWMNAAPAAQEIMNRLAVSVGLTLAYIDDISIKHPIAGGTEDIVASIRRLLDYVRKHNMLLHPGKFFPAAVEAEAFAFLHNLSGTRVSENYKKRIICLDRPETVAQLRHAKGALGYIRPWVYNLAHYDYWFEQLILSHGSSKGKLNWTPEAALAWEQAIWCVINSDMLYHPTRDGEFCIKTDACNYGVGAVLYQKQTDSTGKLVWRIIDMWSKVMPQSLRHCHSMIHEAFALVSACEHWQFHLLKRKFTIATDNSPVAQIFGAQWKELKPITQRQLIRLRSKLSMFCFDAFHVAGIKNALADGLSRFTIDLYKTNKVPYNGRPIISPDTNNKPLTPEQVKELLSSIPEVDKVMFDEFSHKGRLLRGQHNRLIQDSSINTLLTDYVSTHDNLTKFQHIMAEKENNWNQLLKDYRLRSSPAERDRIALFLDSAQQHVIAQDEFSLNETFTKFERKIDPIINDLRKLTPHTINIVSKSLYEDQSKANQEHLLLSTQLQRPEEKVEEKNNHINPINTARTDIRYDPTEDLKTMDLEDAPAPLGSTKMKTRSQTRIEKDIEEQQLYKFVNVDFNNTRLRQKTRDELMHDLFGHRNLDIFNISSFAKYQKDDNIIQLTMNLLSTERTKRSEKDLQFLQQWDMFLYEKLEWNDLRIITKGEKEEKILQAKHWIELDQCYNWNDVVPFTIRGKLMDYAHHNQQCHHFHWRQTFDNLDRLYWWGKMKSDVRKFCETCLLCQYSKGSIRTRSPLRIRSLPAPREHIFADFLGAVYGKYYILVLVDYATGYTMLIPTEGTDAVTIIDSILKYWIPIFGWFKTFETDFGSGFNSMLLSAFTKLAKVHVEFAEPRNHRSIGKVERVIGFTQKVLRRYNLLLNEKLTDNQDEFEDSWLVIETLLPMIQFAFNQRRPRFTTYSPNMLMFGTNLNDISDIERIEHKLKEIRSNKKLNVSDASYLSDLISKLHEINHEYQTDWLKYTKISARSYDTRHNINPKKTKRLTKQFAIGKEVLYYIGDKQVTNKKWRTMWTGPWIIHKKLNDSTIIIADPTSGNLKRVSYDRVKLFKHSHTFAYKDYMESDGSYKEYQANLKENLTNYEVKTLPLGTELDYTKLASDNGVKLHK